MRRIHMPIRRAGILAALSLGVSGCASRLTVAVDKYQGDLTLAREAQEARILSMGKASLSSLFFTFENVQQLRFEIARLPINSPLKEKEDTLKRLQLVLWDVIYSAFRDGLPDASDAYTRILTLLNEQVGEYVNSNPGNAGTTAADAAQIDLKISEDLLKAEPFKQLNLQFNQQKGEKPTIKRHLSFWLQTVAGQHNILAPKDGRPNVPRLVRFAESLRALKLAIEDVDPEAARYMAAKYATQIRKIRESDAAGREPNQVKKWLIQFLHAGYREYTRDKYDDLRRKLLFEGQDCPDQKLATWYYDSLLYNLWWSLDWTYLSMTGLGSFILRSEQPARFKDAIPQPLKDIGAAETAIILKLSKMLEANAESAKNSASPVEQVQTIRRLLEELREMRNPYLQIQATGAYLALDEVTQALAALNRPTSDTFSVWKPVTTVGVQAGANANYVVMRDHLGNWQVKATSNDPTELINAVFGVAAGAVHLAAKSGTGGLSDYLKTLQTSAEARKNEGDAPDKHPLGMSDLLEESKRKHAAALQALDARIQAVEKEIADIRKLDATAQAQKKADLDKHVAGRSQMYQQRTDLLMAHLELLASMEKAMIRAK